jgi:hypothetical protein
MASIARSIGQFGSDIGQGYDINLDWKQRLQNLAFQQAKQKQDALMAPLQLAELQQRIRQMQNPQAAGVEKLPGGGLGGVTFKDGVYSIQNLAPGAPLEPKFSTLQAAAAYYLQKGDFEKLKTVNDEIERTKTQQKPSAGPKDAFELWQSQNPKASVADWLKLQEQYKKQPGEGGTKTPFELWRAQNPKGTYEQWMQASKQEDRGDAIKSVTAVMNAQKSLQSLETGIQKSNKTFSVWNPRTWGTDPALTAITQQAVNDYEAKRQDAVAKLTDAGMPVPAWLTQASGGPQNIPPPTVPPPSGFVLNK